MKWGSDMENSEQFDWQKLKKQIGIIRLKIRRGLHRFDQKYKIRHNGKRLILLVALKTIAALTPGNAAQAQELSLKQDKNQHNTELLAMAKVANLDASVIWERLNAYIDGRQKDFAMSLSADLADNIETVKNGKKKGRKAATLRDLFGPVNNRFYCSISGLKTIEELSKREGYMEYDFLLKCINNPHSCLSVINGLSKYYGDECKTSDIKKTLAEQQAENPNSVFIVLLNSRQNSSSGKHFVIVTPEFAADSVVYVNDNPKLKVYGFNSEVIADPDTYFAGTRNRGHVFNLTEMGRDKLIELFYSGHLSLNPQQQENELIHFEPVGMQEKPRPLSKSRGRSR